MAGFTRHRIDLSAEQDLVTGLIMSTDFCAEVVPVLDIRLLQNKAHQVVAGWCVEYFQKYECAPQQTIQAIFEGSKSQMSAEDLSLIGDTLTLLSNRFETNSSFNLQFMVDKARDYIDERVIRTTIAETVTQLDRGDVKAGALTISGITRATRRMRSMPFKPLDAGYAQKIAATVDNQTLFSLHGDAGKLLGAFKRKWVVSFVGPAKRGKTFQLLNVVHRALQSNLKVYYASLEMDEEEDLSRFYQMLTKSVREGDTTVTIPVFDCYKNQDGSCDKRERCNRVTLLYEDDNGKMVKPEFRPDMPYKPCTVCRDTCDDYQEATWFEQIEARRFSVGRTEKHNAQFRMHHGNNFYMNTYPKFEATLSDIFTDIDYLGVTEGWYPDVLVIDYADILRPESRRYSDPRDDVNDTWKAMSREAGKRKICLFTATQGNRGSFRQSTLDEDAMSEDIRKLANVNMMISINQTPAEKKMGVIRLGIMAHRHRDFNPYRQVKLLYNLSMGAVQLDSMIVDVALS